MAYGTPQQESSAAWLPMSGRQLDALVRSLSSAFEVIGVQKRQGRLTLDRVEDPAALVLDFPPQVHSPKKFLFPNWEKLFRFRLGGRVLLEAEKAAAPRVIFGMHSCDLHAVRVLDDCLFEGEADSAYRAKREATILVGVECTPDSYCFCTSMGTEHSSAGFDLFLHRDGDGFLVETGSRRGAALLRQHAPEVASAPAVQPAAPGEPACFRSIHFPVESLSPLLEEVYEHPAWSEIGHRCLGCGACTLVCPTCYCFNVEDRLDLDLAGGERIRTWDSCQLDQFTRVAGGHDFRADQADRQRHRFFRKYKYLWEKHRRTACVGCGRCIRECLSGIDPTEVLNRLFEERILPKLASAPGAEYQPLLAEITATETLTAQEKLFRLRLDSPMSFAPGNFVQISIFGLGEAPFTITSPPGENAELEIVVRAAGHLTAALHRLKAGDTIGVRGPFGAGFPLEAFTGRDVLLIAGGLGLATLRSLLLTILSRRPLFGRVVLLYGARDISSIIFRDELLAWHTEGLIDCRLTVEEQGNAWGLPAGDISGLLRDLDLPPGRTTVAVSGPPEMYRFTNPLLLRLGFDDQRIFLNLERHMKCGLGKCGKCRINDICVCECGPIFPYRKVRHLKEAIER